MPSLAPLAAASLLLWPLLGAAAPLRRLRVGARAKSLRPARVPSSQTPTQAGSLPLQPLDDSEAQALPICEPAKSLMAWTGKRSSDSIALSIAAWRAQRPHSPVLLDDGGGSGCHMEDVAPLDGDGPAQLFSVAAAPEERVCEDNKDRSLKEVPETPRELFRVTGKLAESNKSRTFFAVWPKDGVCTEQNKCPLVVFFHGCGRYYHFEQMAKYDQACSDSLRSVMLFPSTEKWMETWTGGDSELLDHFVLPLLEKFKKQHAAIVDEQRVVVVGESLGSGIALQAALRRPDLFSAVVAMGITDGSSCEDVEHYHPEKLGIKAVNDTDWNLKLVVATFAEKEKYVENRVSGVLGLLAQSGAANRVAVHFRMIAGTGHAQALDYVQNHWSGLYKAIWQAVGL